MLVGWLGASAEIVEQPKLEFLQRLEAVEFVEAFTIVLVVGVTINWRSSIIGALAAAATLAIIVGTLGVAIVQLVPIDALRLFIGIILILFGLKWLKKAILRYSGLKALHDEEAIFEEKMAEIRARGETVAPRLQPFGVALSYKAVLLEGLEVAFIVIAVGAGRGLLLAASLGALAACILILAAGAMVHRPLSRVPENTLKFGVGVMIPALGVFWTGEGLGVPWPGEDLAIVVFAVLFLVAALMAVALARRPGAEAVR